MSDDVERAVLSSALEKIRSARDARAIVALRGDEAKAIYEAAERAEELDQLFDLRWKADMRAITRWRLAHPGNDLVSPDHADLVVWLLEALTASRSSNEIVEDDTTVVRAVALVRSMAALKCKNEYPKGVIGRDARCHYDEARHIARALSKVQTGERHG